MNAPTIRHLRQWIRYNLFPRLTWMIHPISIFVGIQILSIALISLWVVWFLGRQRDIEELATRVGAGEFTNSTSVPILVSGIVALVLVLVGSVLLFIWGQRQASFVRQQRSFVSSVTHELRTPLASIQLANETLLSRLLPEETKNKLLHMNRLDIDRLTKLVNHILISSRLDRGLTLFQDDIRRFKVLTKIEELCQTLSAIDPDLPQRITLNCASTIDIKLSESAFNLIFSNLLENAIKYSPKESPITIDVTLKDGHVIINIADKGIGLTTKDRKKIFKMFYRSQDATTKAIPGTGLGLYIVKTTLQELRGDIAVFSEGPNRGTTFTISFPES
jgi:signal transduction histidine kinase